MPGQEAVQPFGCLEAGDPEPDADAGGTGGVGGQKGHVPIAGQADDVARGCAEMGLPVAADLHGPEARGQLRREMHLDGRIVRRRAIELGRQRGRRVDHHEVALVEEAGELGEMGVLQRAVGPRRHQHAHGVTGHAAVLGWGGSLELGREGEGQWVQLGEAVRCRMLQRRHRQCAHATAPVERSSAAR